jgi:4a-hydroxytetrahydrobiopterin dehydratase
MTSDLASKSCIPSRAGASPLTADAASRLMGQLDKWDLEQGHLAKSFKFADYAQALAFVARIGAISEHEGHHPEIYLTWGKVSVELWTHKVDGLTESDFILAAKFDEAFKAMARPGSVPSAAG